MYGWVACMLGMFYQLLFTILLHINMYVFKLSLAFAVFL